MGEINKTVDCWPQSAQSLDAVQTLFINRCDINNVLETHPKHGTFQAAEGKLNSIPARTSTRSNEVLNQTDFLTAFAGSWLTVSSRACRKPLCERLKDRDCTVSDGSAQNYVQPDFEHFQWWGIHSCFDLFQCLTTVCSLPSLYPCLGSTQDLALALLIFMRFTCTHQACQDPSGCHPFPLVYQLHHPACCHPQSYRAAGWGNLQEKIRCHPLLI